MLTMYVSLPGEMKEFVENQVNSGRYNSVSEYIRELVRKDEKDRAQERLEPMLLAGTESGSPTALTPENWKRGSRFRNARLEMAADDTRHGSLLTLVKDGWRRPSRHSPFSGYAWV